MPISRSQMPRQMYGLGSFVKSIGKGIKKIVKSPIGKAAILGFGANALMPGGLSSLFGSGSFNPLLRKTLGGDFAQSQFGSLLSGAKNFLGSNVGKFVTGATAGKLFGGMEPQQIQDLKGDPEALANYLRLYYSELNKTASSEDIENFVQRNMQADGGRIGYAEGMKDPTYTGNNMEDLPRGLQIDTTTSNPMPKEKSLKENLEFVKETKGGVSPSTTMYMFKMYLDEALEKGQITKEKYNKMLMPLFGKTGEGVTRDFERYEQKMAYGGRINRAYGSDELVEQASGIEGLDININPKGVKELDLRETGGFIPPVGVKEKADDIPAMLSNNEFVFTADAVRAAGGGSVNKGAQIMYDTMKKLENGGTV